MKEWEDISQLVTYIGVPGAMALALVYAITKGWLVPGWLYREEKARAEKWEHRALEGLRIAADAVSVADTSLQVATKKDGSTP